VEALEREMQERGKQSTTEQMIAEGTDVVRFILSCPRPSITHARIFQESELKDKVQKHSELKQQLSELYSSIFDGPTPGEHLSRNICFHEVSYQVL
jgi:hypothetical protein